MRWKGYEFSEDYHNNATFFAHLISQLRWQLLLRTKSLASLGCATHTLKRRASSRRSLSQCKLKVKSEFDKQCVLQDAFQSCYSTFIGQTGQLDYGYTFGNLHSGVYDVRKVGLIFRRQV